MTKASDDQMLIVHNAATAAANEHFQKMRLKADAHFKNSLIAIERNYLAARAGAEAIKSRSLRKNDRILRTVESRARLVFSEVNWCL